MQLFHTLSWPTTTTTLDAAVYVDAVRRGVARRRTATQCTAPLPV